jgi:hypothetical protein
VATLLRDIRWDVGAHGRVMPALHRGKAEGPVKPMLAPKLEPCLICDNPECEAHVLATTIEPDKKRFNLKENSLEFTCPSCDELVCVPIFEVRWLNVANQHVQNDAHTRAEYFFPQA